VITKSRHVAIAAIWLALMVLSACVQLAALDNKKEPDKKKQEKSYGLIFGTAYGPDDRPLYGVKVTIHPEGKKHPKWELVSDHRGEFAQRVPTAAADYLITGEAEYMLAGKDGKPDKSKKKKLRGETRVHMEGEIRQDIGLHLAE
jgi:hypothetical protein